MAYLGYLGYRSVHILHRARDKNDNYVDFANTTSVGKINICHFCVTRVCTLHLDYYLYGCI